MTPEEHDQMVKTGVAPCGCPTEATADGLMRSTGHTEDCALLAKPRAQARAKAGKD